MGVVGGARVNAPAARDKHVQDMPAVPHLVRERGCPVVYLQGVGSRDGLDVGNRKAVVGRMSHDDECSVGRGPGASLTPVSPASDGAKSIGRPAATMCHRLPTWVLGACSSAPIRVVNPPVRSDLVSVIG